MTTIIETTNIETLTQVQLLQAYKLAGAYNHTWATFQPMCDPDRYSFSTLAERERFVKEYENYSQGYIELMQCTTPAEIDALSRRRLKAGICGWGITAPTLDNDNIIHTTGTGRLAWKVEPDGTTELVVLRENGAYISATISNSELLEVACSNLDDETVYRVSGDEQEIIEYSRYERYSNTLTSLPKLPAIHRRHIDALRDAVNAACTGSRWSNAEDVHPLIDLLYRAARPDGVIISRHPAAVEFVIRNVTGARNFPVLDYAEAKDVRGQHVYGNVPLHLAALADRVTVVEFRGDAPRGTEYTLDQMIQADAELTTYKVTWSY